MIRVAIIFENYGNPGQPYLSEWRKRLGVGTEQVKIKAFTDRLYSENNDDDVVELKPRGTRKWLLTARFLGIRLIKKNWPVFPGHFYLKKYQPDLIHLINAQQFDQYFPMATYLGSKLIVSFRGYETSVRPQLDDAWRNKLHEIYLKASALHFVSHYLRNEAISMGAPMDKCNVIYRSVDTNMFRPPDSGPSDNIEKKILAVGRLTWQKGYNYLLDAMKSVLKTHNCSLLIIGDGDGYAEIIKKIDDLEISQFVKVIRSVNRTELISHMQSGNIFVQASVSDALPNTLLEASSCGLPIISTRVGGIPEVVMDAETGILVDAKDDDALAKAIVTLLSSSKLCKEMGSHARNKCQHRFSSNNELQNWVDYYSTIIANTKSMAV